MKLKRWEEYKEFFQLIILKYLVMWFALVPVIAGLVSQLPDPLPIRIADNTYPISLSLPFPWQLLWISSLFFVIALGIYKTRCPKFIQKYNNFSDYSKYKHHPRWLTWEAYYLLKVANDKEKKKLCKRLVKKNYIEKLVEGKTETLCAEPVVEDNQTSITFKVESTSYRFGMPILGDAANVDSEKDIFYELFGRYSESRITARFFIKSSLVISLILFLFSLLIHICNGGKYAWNWLMSILGTGYEYTGHCSMCIF